ELYAADNEIADLSSLAMMDTLEILDLENNSVSDPDQVEHLAQCGALASLVLLGNPLAAAVLHTTDTGQPPPPHADPYRAAVRAALPALSLLDRSPLAPPALLPPTHRLADLADRAARAAAGRRCRLRPRSAAPRRGARPASAAGSGGAASAAVDHSSDLTFGTDTTLAGNPILFLRARRPRTGAATPSAASNAAAIDSAAAAVVSDAATTAHPRHAHGQPSLCPNACAPATSAAPPSPIARAHAVAAPFLTATTRRPRAHLPHPAPPAASAAAAAAAAVAPSASSQEPRSQLPPAHSLTPPVLAPVRPDPRRRRFVARPDVIPGPDGASGKSRFTNGFVLSAPPAHTPSPPPPPTTVLNPRPMRQAFSVALVGGAAAVMRPGPPPHAPPSLPTPRVPGRRFPSPVPSVSPPRLLLPEPPPQQKGMAVLTAAYE
ncbi:Leucine-rich repeat-containing protein 56, partial [Cladochytrium tenue]